MKKTISILALVTMAITSGVVAHPKEGRRVLPASKEKNSCFGGPIAVNQLKNGNYVWEKCTNGGCPDDDTFCNTKAVGCAYSWKGKPIPFNVCWQCNLPNPEDCKKPLPPK